jgi:response regulator RpfG family c-di-GMP phosphodiesterase
MVAGAGWAHAASRGVVVCVDDDPAILRSYGRLLRNEPYDVLTFDDPRKALAWIDRTHVDLVLTDERMPAMTGTEFLEEVNRRSPRTSAALITAFPEPGVVARNTSARILRLLAKPWDDQDLKGTIRDLLSGRSPRAEETRIRSEATGDSRVEARIDLAGLTSPDVLEQIIPLCLWSHGAKQRPVVVLENVSRFRDPLPELVRDLARVVERVDARISVRDATGAFAACMAGER